LEHDAFEVVRIDARYIALTTFLFATAVPATVYHIWYRLRFLFCMILHAHYLVI